MTHRNVLMAAFLTLSLSTLFGCGGGSSGVSNTNHSADPQTVNNNNFVGVNVLSRATVVAPIVTTTANTLTISYPVKPGPDEHFQFYLNVDNNPVTGFRFNNEIWDDAGTDYLVEDGILFKSTANDSTWSWNENVAPVIYHQNDSGISVTINKSDLHGLSPTIRVGVMKRDTNWNVASFYPRSSLMAEYSINIEPPADDTIAPIITLKGSNHIVLALDSDFTDPGATASDNVDGNISDKITTDSNLDTSTLGQYKIIYRVSDAAGNSSSATRTISIVESRPDGIVIDGNTDDWASIPTLAQDDKATFKISDKSDKLYVLVDSNESLENTQIFMDVDNDTSTGNQLSGSVWSPAGVDYMIENNHLDKSVNSAPWSWNWDYNNSPIDFIKQGNTIEIAIPKSALEFLGNTIKIGFANRNADWNVKSLLPANAMVNYSLNTQVVSKVLLPNFCNGSIWETDGTPAFTHESHLASRSSHNDLLIKHKNNWYTVYESINGSTGEKEVDIVKFDGVHNILFLPLQRVRNEPLGSDTITDMKFLGDNLYFVFANELWSKRNNKIVKKFAGKEILGLYPSRNFIAVHVKDLVTDLNETWIMNAATDTLNERVFKVEVKNASPLFTHKAKNTVYLTDGTDYYLSDYTHFNQKLDMMPLTSRGEKVYFAKDEGPIDNNFHLNKYSLWVKNGSESLKQLDTVVSGKPKVPEANGAAYIIAANFPVTRGGLHTLFYLWRFDESTDEVIKIVRKGVSQHGVNAYILSPSFIHGHDYFIKQRIRVTGTPGNYTTLFYLSRDLYVGTGNGNSEGIRTRPLELPTVGNESNIAGLVHEAGNLYYLDTRYGTKNISMINAASNPDSGQYTPLGSCN